jgi:exonuclease 3'-5' domain-containing protein 1
VESDPACVKILTELDDATSVLTSPGEALDRALRACVSSDVLAVDLEGVSMSRVGPVTLLQVAARDRVFLFDAQALGTAELFERAVRPESSEDGDAEDGDAGARTLRCVLEDPRITKLMFDCRVDSDALFHQHGVALRGVFDVQLADVASRRRKNLAVPLLSGMPKCAARHLAGAGRGATAASLAALDADPADGSVTRAGATSEAEAVTRVTEHLKTRVKSLYAPDKGGDARLWALRPISLEMRRYAALDVWLLLRIHGAMTEDQALDDAWRARVVAASPHRETEYRALAEPVLQFRDPERAVAQDL